MAILRISLTIETPPEAISQLLQLSVERMEAGQEQLLLVIGELVASNLQENIRTEGQRTGEAWPDLHPVTRKIREYYGHTAGKLVRGGDLLHSIRVLEVGPTFVDVGSRLPYASVLDTGGRWEGREVQAFPYLHLSEQDHDDLLEVALAFYAEGN